MKIYFHPTDGEPVEATLPTPHSLFVIVSGDCPVCTGKNVIVAHDIRETVIFSEADRGKALLHLVEKGSAVYLLGQDDSVIEEQVPMSPGHWMIKGVNPQVGEYRAESDAICTRCYSNVGGLQVEFDTLFGRTEDALVLSGSYGLVIGGD